MTAHSRPTGSIAQRVKKELRKCAFLSVYLWANSSAIGLIGAMLVYNIAAVTVLAFAGVVEGLSGRPFAARPTTDF